jgi:hypothetical protein
MMVACDKRHKPDLTNLDHKADADETLNGNNIPATQGNAGDQVSNSNPTIDLNPTTGTTSTNSTSGTTTSSGTTSGTVTSSSTTTTVDEESSSATQSDCSREFSTRCGTSTTNSTTPVATPTADVSTMSSGSVVTLASGLDFYRPTNPAVVRCGSIINQYIDGSYCSVNSYTGASQPLGMVMKMKNSYGTTGPACPKVCMCTGESLTMSGWSCQHLPKEQSYKVLIQGCGSRIKTFYPGTSKQTTCAINKGGSILPKGTVKGMKLLTGQQSVCSQASCVCKGKVTLNRKFAGWKCTLDVEETY